MAEQFNTADAFLNHIVNYYKPAGYSYSAALIAAITNLLTGKNEELPEKLGQIYSSISLVSEFDNSSSGSIIGEKIRLEHGLFLLSVGNLLIDRLDDTAKIILIDRIDGDPDKIGIGLIDHIYTRLKSISIQSRSIYNRFELPVLLNLILRFRRTKSVNKKEFATTIVTAMKTVPGINTDAVDKLLRLLKRST